MRKTSVYLLFALTVSSFVPTKQGYGQEPPLRSASRHAEGAGGDFA